MAARLALILLAAWALLGGCAQAQQYQRLRVLSFALTSDTAAPQLEQPFHVTLTIRVAQRVADIDNVFLPSFDGAEDLGDLRAVAQGPHGTTYRETLTLVAHTRGILTISPAYLDAVDARDGKAKRFVSNSLRLPVGGGPVTAVWDDLRTAAFVAIDLVLLAALVFVLAAIFWRRRRPAAAPPAYRPPDPAPPPRVPEDGLATALDRLRRRRDRGAVFGVRAALWRTVGAREGETLGDALARPKAAQAEIRRMLLVVERAAFIEDARLHEAIEEVLCSRQS